MNLRNCSRCGKLYVFSGQQLCPDCFKEQEDDFEKVRAYLQEHPGANLEQVHQATGVDRSTILHFMRTGRLTAREGFAKELCCERCGRPLASGRLCTECRSELSRRLKDASHEPARGRVYLVDRIMDKRRQES